MSAQPQAAAQRPLHRADQDMVAYDDGAHVSLQGANRCFLIKNGRLDLAIDCGDQSQVIAEMVEGEIILGLEGRIGLSGRARGDLRLCPIELSVYCSPDADPEQRLHRALSLDIWLARLNNIAQEYQQGRAPTDQAVVAQGITWVKDPDGAEALPRPHFPQDGSPGLDGSPNSVFARDTEALLARPRAAAAIAAANGHLAQAIAAGGQSKSEALIRRRAQQVTQDAARLDRAFGQLSASLSATGAAADQESGSAQAAAGFSQIAHLAKRVGLGLSAVDNSKGLTGRDYICALCEANNIRYRSITLTEKWWRKDCGDFVAFDGDGQVLTVMRETRSYVVQDANGEKRRFCPEMAATWEGQGLFLYWPLPDQPVTGWDLIGRVFRICASDLWTVFAVSLAMSLLALVLPIGAGILVGKIIPQESQALLVQLGVILALVAMVQFAIGIISQIAAARIETRATLWIQGSVMDRILRLPTGFFRSYSSGELTQRALAISRLERLVTNGMITGVLSGLFSFLSFGLMFHFAPGLVLPALGAAAVFITIAAFLGRAETAAARSQILTSGPVIARMMDIAQGIEKLRFAAAEAPAFERWTQAFQLEQSAAYREKRMAALMETFSGSFLATATLMVFVVIGLRGSENEFSTASLVSFLTCFASFMTGLGHLTRTATQLASFKPIYDFAAPILQAVPENSQGGTDPGALLGEFSLTNLRFAYKDQGPMILDGLSLTIGAGEYVALVGDSGCGKSTLLRLLMGFETPKSGSVSLDKIDLRKIDKRLMRRQFGVVMQDAKLLPGSIYDNIVGTNFDMPMEQVSRAIRQVGLEDDIQQMPMGLQTGVVESSGGLSGGQVQRIMLARAIAASPRVLLLDEATSALDNRTQSIVTETLDGMTATRIVVAHRLSTVVKADKIIVLDHGKVVEVGDYDSLMALEGKFASLAQRQLV
ncbi:ATP-binding cassette domain-containing protein [Pseudophaeobacter arcticus]|uniref:ATP-binding cassette domain-containing protein n=1 Tax=Pseudophaeobacter arcticus TaxID=385492 RepID=UPI003A974D86